MVEILNDTSTSFYIISHILYALCSNICNSYTFILQSSSDNYDTTLYFYCPCCTLQAFPPFNTPRPRPRTAKSSFALPHTRLVVVATRLLPG